MNPTKSLAFSLIEIMVGLIVTSIMVAAFAPVITKRVSFGGVALSTAKSSSISDKIFVYDPSKNGHDGCSLSSNVLSCPFKVPNGVYSINALLVSPGGGGGASSANVQGTTNKNYTSSTNFQIEAGTSKIDITNIISGGGGGGGGARLKYSTTTTVQTSSGSSTTQTLSPSADNCAKIEAGYDSTNGYCVTKYNIGQGSGSTSWSGITKSPAGSSCSAASSQMCCWTGSTSSDCTSSGTYNACTRTMCMPKAAKQLCDNYSITNGSYSANNWELPTQTIRKSWNATFLKSIYACDGKNASHTGYKCAYSSSCTGASANRCLDTIMVSDLVAGTRTRTVYRNGAWKETTGNLSTSFGAHTRCITSSILYKTSTSPTYSTTTTNYAKAAGGGGGASGTKLTNITIPEAILKNNIGNDLFVEVGTGGSGGDWEDSSSQSTSASASSGSRGGSSSVYIKVHGTSTIIWGVRALGGHGGGGGYASSSSVSSGSGGSSGYTIQYYNTSTKTWTTLSNSSQLGTTYSIGYPRGGTSGSSGSTSSTSDISEQQFSGGSGGSIDSYGVGGNGGNSKYGYGGASGFDGSPGFVSLSVQKLQKGNAGGGGGGGSMARIENITVTPGKTITLKIGKSGSGGTTVGANGTNGNLVSITYNGKTYSLSGGSAGKGGTTSLGSGGSASTVPSSIKSDDHTTYYRDGSSGKSGATLPSSRGDGSSGGLGGFSGITNFLHSEYSIDYNSLINGCGGLSKDTTYNCFRESSPDAAFSSSASFTPPNRPYEQDSKDYGSAGTGGGGGGIKLNLSGYTFGKGSNGLDGYIYLWWQTIN